MGPQGSGVFSPQSPLTPARDTHLGLIPLIMDCLETMASPEQAGLIAELGRGGGGLARLLSACFPPVLKGITWENNPFINNVNININRQGSNSVGKAQTHEKKGKINQTRKSQILNYRRTNT